MASRPYPLEDILSGLELNGFRTVASIETEAGAIAHTTFGPSGVYVFETEAADGKVRAEDLGATIGQARDKANALHERLERGGSRVNVTPVVVLMTGKLRGKAPADVRIVTPAEVEKLMAARRELEYHEIARCLSLIASDFVQRRQQNVVWA